MRPTRATATAIFLLCLSLSLASARENPAPGPCARTCGRAPAPRRLSRRNRLLRSLRRQRSRSQSLRRRRRLPRRSAPCLNDPEAGRQSLRRGGLRRRGPQLPEVPGRDDAGDGQGPALFRLAVSQALSDRRSRRPARPDQPRATRVAIPEERIHGGSQASPGLIAISSASAPT